MKKIITLISALRLVPHIFLFNYHHNRKTLQYDAQRWLKIGHKSNNLQFGFILLMTWYPEYRNLFYKRLGKYSALISWLCPKMSTLYIHSENIGPGLFIQHGFATIISAKSIGKDCWINQQVTIGFNSKMGQPKLGDNVTINAGAKIIGDVTIGNNSIVGANAVVTKNIPKNSTVVGVPAYIIRRDGIKVKEEL